MTGTDVREGTPLLDLYAQMLLIRRFEEKVNQLFLRGEIYGSTHLCVGQEAVSAGVVSALGPDDRVSCTYRGHGHALALGVDPTAFMAELTGRSAGLGGGRAGSMNAVDLEHRLIGCFGIVGGSLAAATGAAMALKRNEGVSVAFFGDGAVNQGYFLECVNFATVMKLPVLYVCENNQYGEYTPMEKVTPGGIRPRAEAFGIPVEFVDGQDVVAVRKAALKCVEQARSGGGPVFLEAFTYRYSDHGRGDPYKYRSDEEIAAWKERDPLKLGRASLLETGLEEAEIDAVESRVAAEVEAIAEAALAAPFPEPDHDFEALEFAPDGSAR
jgi:TPP-dependent pyruvate/acetoin dehydrogenase alpha subunit